MVSNIQIDRWSKRLLLLGIGLALLAPVVYNGAFVFPFVVPKNVLFRVAAAVAFSSWLVRALVNPLYRPSRRLDGRNVAALLACTWLAINVVTASLGVDVLRSFFGTLERMGGVVQTASTVLFFISLLYGVRQESIWNALVTFSVAISSLAVLVGVGQYLGVVLGADVGGVRIGGIAGNSIFFASYLVLHLFLIGYLFADTSRVNWRVLAGTLVAADIFFVVSMVFNVAIRSGSFFVVDFFRSAIARQVFSSSWFVVILLTLHGAAILTWRMPRALFTRLWLSALILFELFVVVQTQARGPIVGLLLGYIVVGLGIIFLNSNKIVRYSVLGVIAAGGLLVALLFVFKDSSFVRSQPVLHRLTSISIKDTTVESRLLVWQAARNGIMNSPRTMFIGVGPENFYSIFNAHYPIGIYKDAGSPQWFDRAHNIFIDSISTTGFLGFATYIGLVLTSLWLGARGAKRDYGIIVFCGLIVAYLVQGMFVFDTLNTDVPLFFVMSLAIFSAGISDVGRTSLQSPKKWQLGLILLLLATFIFIQGHILVVDHRMTDVKIIIATGKSQFDQNLAPMLLDAASETYPIGHEAKILLFSYAESLVSQGIKPTDNDNFLLSAQHLLELAAERNPYDTELVLMLGTLNNWLSPYDARIVNKNILLLTRAAIRNETRPTVYFELARAQAIAGDTAGGLKTFEKGVALAPNVADSQWNLLGFCIYAKQFDCADRTFKKLREIQVARDSGPLAYWDQWPRLVDAYTQVGQWEKAIEFQKKTLETNPGGPTGDGYSRLAALYQKAGKIELARDAAKQAMAIDPSLAPDAQAFIDSLK